MCGFLHIRTIEHHGRTESFTELVSVLKKDDQKYCDALYFTVLPVAASFRSFLKSRNTRRSQIVHTPTLGQISNTFWYICQKKKPQKEFSRPIAAKLFPMLDKQMCSVENSVVPKFRCGKDASLL